MLDQSITPVSPLMQQRRLAGLCEHFGLLLVSILALSTSMLGVSPASYGQESPRPERERLKVLVETLSSAEYEGRRGEGGRKTAAWLIEEMRLIRLEPLFQGQFVQTIPPSELVPYQGRNVGGILHGSDPALRDEWVILAAHYDHLGIRRGVLYPGADDNASGVAMLLEVARSMATAPQRPRRNVMFIGFDQEEVGLYGSRYFVGHPPVPLDRIKLFVTADMIGRSLGGICEAHVFVMGTEHTPGLRSWIEDAARSRPIKIGLLGSDLLVLNRSDYGPFRSRQIPFLFFTTGENPRYHSPQDTPETLNYVKLAEISQVMFQVISKAASTQGVPRWNIAPDHPMEEAITLRDVLRQLIEHRETLRVGTAQLMLMNTTLRTLEGIVARGVITPAERSSVIQSARLVLLTIF